MCVSRSSEALATNKDTPPKSANHMKTEVHYYHIHTPGVSMTILGGPLLPGDAGHVWITTPTGKPLLQVPRSAVTLTNAEETAQRVAEAQ